MKYEIKYKPSYAMLVVTLDQGETITAEAGAMTYMDPTIETHTRLHYTEIRLHRLNTRHRLRRKMGRIHKRLIRTRLIHAQSHRQRQPLHQHVRRNRQTHPST